MESPRETRSVDVPDVKFENGGPGLIPGSGHHPGPGPGQEHADQEAPPPGCCQKLYPNGFRQELKELLKLAGPMILTQVTIYILGPVALIFCGHLGKVELDAVALANSLLNVTAISLAVGLSSACDTLFSQVFGSANRHKLGILLQRSVVIIGLASLLSVAIHLNAEALCRALGQDPEVSRLAGEYLLILIPGTVSFYIYISVSKYMQNQNIILPVFIVGAIVNVLNALLHYLFLYVGTMRTEGSALAQSISYFLMMLLSVAYVYFSGVYKATWKGFDWECFQGWGQFFYLGIFGMLMICIEWWSFEIGIILAGILGTTELGAQSSVFQIEMIAYMVPLGNGISASIRVGQFLGAGEPKSACTSARVAITLACLTGVTVSILVIVLSEYLPLVFSSVEEVVDLATTIFPIVGFYMFFDSVAGTCAGILRGSGRQTFGAFVVLCGYVVGLSSGIPLMFLTPVRLLGFWGGLAGALVLESIVFAIVVFRTDWQEQSEKAMERAKVGQTPDSGDPGIEDDNDADENTALTTSNKLGKTSIPTIYRSISFTPEVDSDPDDLPLRTLIPRRVAAILLMVGILVLGIVLRFTINIDHSQSLSSPVTDVVGNWTQTLNSGTDSGL